MLEENEEYSFDDYVASLTLKRRKSRHRSTIGSKQSSIGRRTSSLFGGTLRSRRGSKPLSPTTNLIEERYAIRDDISTITDDAVLRKKSGVELYDDELLAETWDSKRKPPLHHFKTVPENATAKRIRKCILEYMGDKKTKKEGSKLLASLLEIGIRGSQNLKNEIFGQLIKQTTNCPSQESLMNGWKMLSVVSGFFYPDKELEPYLLSHYANVGVQNASFVVQDCAKYALHRYTQLKSVKPRKFAPLDSEVSAVEMRSQSTHSVFLVDGRKITLPLESWTTAKEVCQRIAEEVRLFSATNFALFEYCEGVEYRRMLEPEDVVLEVLASWSRAPELGAKVNKLVYKMYIVEQVNLKDTVAVDLEYHQARLEVKANRLYIQKEEDFLLFTALETAIENPDEISTDNLMSKLDSYFPAGLLSQSFAAEWRRKLLEAKEKFRNCSSFDLKVKYLDYIRQWKTYGSVRSFFVTQTTFDHLPKAVELKINSTGIFLVNEHGDIMFQCHMEDILDYESNKNRIFKFYYKTFRNNCVLSVTTTEGVRFKAAFEAFRKYRMLKI